MLLTASLCLKVAFLLSSSALGKIWYSDPVWYSCHYYVPELVVAPVFVAVEIVAQRRRIKRKLAQKDMLSRTVSARLDTNLLETWIMGDGDVPERTRSGAEFSMDTADGDKAYLILGLAGKNDAVQ